MSSEKKVEGVVEELVPAKTEKEDKPLASGGGATSATKKEPGGVSSEKKVEGVVEELVPAKTEKEEKPLASGGGATVFNEEGAGGCVLRRRKWRAWWRSWCLGRRRVESKRRVRP